MRVGTGGIVGFMYGVATGLAGGTATPPFTGSTGFADIVGTTVGCPVAAIVDEARGVGFAAAWSRAVRNSPPAITAVTTTNAAMSARDSHTTTFRGVISY